MGTTRTLGTTAPGGVLFPMSGPLDPIPVPGASVPADSVGRPDAPVDRSARRVGAVGASGPMGGGGPGGCSGFGHISLYMTHAHLKPLFSMELRVHNIPLRLSVPFLHAIRSLLFGNSFRGFS